MPDRTFAKTMRSHPTEAERVVWQIVRAGRINGLKFKRQVPMGPYIADFVCHDARLIVEIDGSQHADSLEDVARDAYFAAAGYRTLRIWNSDALSNRDGVYSAIVAASA